MRILITNDDGIYSEGLWKLAEALSEIGQVSVVAPDRNLSGAGTAMTLISIIRADKFASPLSGVEAYAVQGTPSDCVVLGMKTLFNSPFDVVASGINQGANIGMDVLISGTVGGALRGYFNGVPSMAVSSAYRHKQEIRYELAAEVARELARSLRDRNVTEPMLLNVNVPDQERASIECLDVTNLGPVAYIEEVETGQDGIRTHYWVRHRRPADIDVPSGTDVWAVRNGRISITPLDILGGNQCSSSTVEALARDVRGAFNLR